MKKVVLSLLLIFLVVPSVLALNFDVQKVSNDEVFIIGLNQPATFDLNVTNLGASDDFTFYSFFGQDLLPK